MRIFLIGTLSIIIALFAGCGEDEHDHSGHNHDHDHEHGHDHGDHDHEHGHADKGDHDHKDGGHGEDHKLGKLQIGNVGFTIHQFGEVVGKEEGVFTLVLENGSTNEVRVWVGQEDGRGSVKGLLEFDKEKKEYHGHVELPKEVGEKAALWVELTDANSRVTKGTIPLHR